MFLCLKSYIIMILLKVLWSSLNFQFWQLWWCEQSQEENQQRLKIKSIKHNQVCELWFSWTLARTIWSAKFVVLYITPRGRVSVTTRSVPSFFMHISFSSCSLPILFFRLTFYYESSSSLIFCLRLHTHFIIVTTPYCFFFVIHCMGF